MKSKNKKNANGVGLLKIFAVFFIASHFVSPVGAQNDSHTNLLLILDASGSMWQKVEGEFKIVVARKVLKDLLGELPADSKVGLIAYGHRKKADCADIETIVPLAALDKAALGQKIDAIDPKGKTPITDAVKAAFEMVRSKAEATTIVVVSDGLETCGGAPCEAVEEAKKAGLKFVMHVIGFDLSQENVSELECAAQAGGGLYLSAHNADELADALKKTAVAPEIPPGRLSVKATVHGKLEDVRVRVFKAGTKEDVASARTYSSPKTNPRIFPVPEGTYDIEVTALRLKGDVSRTFKNVEVRGDEIVEKEVDFTPGELSIKVTRNGQLSDATVNVYRPGTHKSIAGGRTYTSPNHNPAVYKITPGVYNVDIKSVEISGAVEHRWEGVVVEAGAKTEREHDFTNGTLSIKVTRNGQPSDATVNIYNPRMRKNVARGRTYTSVNFNPAVYKISPGNYNILLKSMEISGGSEHKFDGVTVEAAAKTTLSHDFISGTIKIGAVHKGELLDVSVSVINAATNKSVSGGRTYADAKSNPKTFEVPPGKYRVTVKAVKLEGRPKKEIEVTVEKGEVTVNMIDFWK